MAKQKHVRPSPARAGMQAWEGYAPEDAAKVAAKPAAIAPSLGGRGKPRSASPLPTVTPPTRGPAAASTPTNPYITGALPNAIGRNVIDRLKELYEKLSGR